MSSLRFNCGTGAAQIVSESRIVVGQWHTVTVFRDGMSGWLRMDNDTPISGRSQVTVRHTYDKMGINHSVCIKYCNYFYFSVDLRIVYPIDQCATMKQHKAIFCSGSGPASKYFDSNKASNVFCSLHSFRGNIVRSLSDPRCMWVDLRVLIGW